MRLCEPLGVGSRTAPSSVVFGPIVTNLGTDSRSLSERHTAFYARRAAGGAGLVVVEGASVHGLDWPYERAPLAERCQPGWADIVAACRPFGTLVLAGLDHTGGQGSSAYSQRELWAPSRVPEVNSREVPKWMEAQDIAAVIDGFAHAAAGAARADCDGVEINAGQHSLLRQFLSGLTNHRDDEWGHDRLALARRVLAAVRAALGADRVLGLRLSCDELAPWAGITPEMAPGIAAELAAELDYLVVVRGSIYSAEKTRADFHEPTLYNRDLCAAVKAALPSSVAVILQGSVIAPAEGEAALADGVCDGVEMTRALLADADLVAKVRRGDQARVRPCLRCNQTCQVRDVRNPIISCVVEPSTGHETDDPGWYQPALASRRVSVVGGGPAGLETARVAAERGHQVTLFERSPQLGGLAAVAGPGAPLIAWQQAELAHLGVTVLLGMDYPGAGGQAAGEQAQPGGEDEVIVQCSGGRPGPAPFVTDGDAVVVDVAALRQGEVSLPAEGAVVVFDPIGGPIAVALAAELGSRAVLVTQDNIAGNELSRTGDLAPANVRLQQQQVRIVARALLRRVAADHVVLEDRYSGQLSRIDAVATVDCGFREPTPPLASATLRAGDCVAPRTVYEAVLEGRRAALAIDTAGPARRLLSPSTAHPAATVTTPRQP